MSSSSRSMSEIKRLIKQGAVKVNGKKITDYRYIPKPGDEIQVGKGEFIKIKDDKK